MPGEGSVFDSLDLWIDPQPDSLDKPHASTLAAKSISSVSAIGFATGRKTEPTDRIWIDELILGRTWESVLGLPPKPGRKKPSSVPNMPEPLPTEQLVDFRDDVYPILQFAEEGFALDAEYAPHLRGLVDIYEGPKHLYQALIVASEIKGDLMRYEFKRNTVATAAMAGRKRNEDAIRGQFGAWFFF